MKMSPLCFLMLINNALDDTEFQWKYFDDFIVGISINNDSPDCTLLQNTLNKFFCRTLDDKATINYNKAVVMHFNISNSDIFSPNLTIYLLTIIKSAKFLEIILDDKLIFKIHI